MSCEIQNHHRNKPAYGPRIRSIVKCLSKQSNSGTVEVVLLPLIEREMELRRRGKPGAVEGQPRGSESGDSPRSPRGLSCHDGAKRRVT